MDFNINDYLVDRSPQAVSLPLAFCETCRKNGLQPLCLDHETAKVKTVDLKVRKLPWMKKNQIVSACVYWDLNGASHFKADEYTTECLKYIIVEAPWGATSESFLLQIADSPLSSALETLLPKAFEQTDDSHSINQLKKG